MLSMQASYVGLGALPLYAGSQKPMTHDEPGSVQFQTPTGVSDELMAAQAS